MGKKSFKISSLQEYARKKRKNRVNFLNHEDCNYCEFFRKENRVCLGGGKIAELKNISYCPITKNSLTQI